MQTGASTRAVTQLFCTLDKAGSAARALHAPFTARTYHTRRFLTCTKFLQVNNFERKKNYLYAAPRTGRLLTTPFLPPSLPRGSAQPPPWSEWPPAALPRRLWPTPRAPTRFWRASEPRRSDQEEERAASNSAEERAARRSEQRTASKSAGERTRRPHDCQ